MNFEVIKTSDDNVLNQSLEFAEEYYRKNGIKKIILDSQYPVKDFYEKCGYKTVSDIFMEVNIPHVKMEKKI